VKSPTRWTGSSATRWTCVYHADLGAAFAAFGYQGYDLDENPGYVWTSPCEGTGSVPNFLYAVVLADGRVAVPQFGDEEAVVATIEEAEEIVRRMALEEMGEVL
jgi:hypothetical protein